MKKQHLKSLNLNKISISSFSTSKIRGGSISTLRFLCTNHPTQDSDFCSPPPPQSDGCPDPDHTRGCASWNVACQ